MTGQHYTATIYESDSAVDRIESLLQILSSVGFIDVSVEEKSMFPAEPDLKITASYSSKSEVLLATPFQDETPGEIDALKISAIFRENLYPDSWDSDDEYKQFFDSCIEFLCEIAARLNPTYIALFEIGDWQAVHPTDTPLTEHITVAPPVGVYSSSLLADLGGLESLYDDVSLRREELDSGHVLVVTDQGPWSSIIFETDGTDPGPTEVDDVNFSDPFTGLKPSEYATDAVVAKDEIAPELTNEALTLERVYRDDSDNLRRIDDDSFVRRLVGSDGAMGELPDDADPDDERVSALVEGSIPPAFVRLDEPDGETVVSKTLSLDIETSTFDLLVSLARTAQAEDVSDDVIETIEGILDELGEMDDEDGIDQYIQAKLL